MNNGGTKRVRRLAKERQFQWNTPALESGCGYIPQIIDLQAQYAYLSGLTKKGALGLLQPMLTHQLLDQGARLGAF